MERLTAMTIGAAMLGLAGFAYDSASAQPPKACSTQAVDIYFEKDSADFNVFSQQLVERMAAEARSCGARQVLVERASGADRAKAISAKLKSLGVKAILTGPAIAPEGETIADRSVTLRIASGPTGIS